MCALTLEKNLLRADGEIGPAPPMRFELIIASLCLALGCKPAQVFVVDSTGAPTYSCGPGRGAYVTADGKAAVCMRQSTAEFVTCVTAISAGNQAFKTRAEEGIDTKGLDYLEIKALRKQEDERTVAESVQLANARAESLKVCSKLLEDKAVLKADQEKDLAERKLLPPPAEIPQFDH